jgi:hypothetical protein
MESNAGTHGEQLEWERRLGPPVAVAAVLAGLLMLQPLFVRPALSEDRRGIEDTPDSLLSLHEHTSGFLASAIGEAIGVLALGVVFYYLFRATRYRGPELPAFFKWLILIGPVLFAAGSVAGVIEPARIADLFADGSPIRGEAGDRRADRLLEDISPIAVALPLAAHFAVAFLYVMLPLRAMRVGLLSRFMGILGVILGALYVLPIVPPQLVQLFWLGAFAALIVGYWPSGRGPAWDTGEAIAWPSPTREARLGGGESPAEPEALPDRPASRKRKRK